MARNGPTTRRIGRRIGNAIAVDFGRRRLGAVHASDGSGLAALKVHRALFEEFPADLKSDDADAVGRWIGSRLRSARFPRTAATIAIGREHVGLKRITLPTTEPDELPDMTRLALQRELPFDADSAVIDFIPLDRTATSTTVLAVAVPRTVIDHARAVAAAAGLGIDRISLRTMGAGALLRDFGFSILDFGLEGGAESPAGQAAMGSANGDEPRPSPPNPKSKIQNPKSNSVLAIDVTGESVEFCLVSEGSVRLSRAAEVPQPQDDLAVADAVVTESRRTWMSYRVGDDAPDVRAAVVMGDRRIGEYAAGPLGEMLRIPVSVLREHPRISTNGQAMERVWPLAGMLLEPTVAGELIDFAHPRAAPDLGARDRVRRLAVAGLILVLLGAMGTFARLDLRRLRQQDARLLEQKGDAQPGYARHVRDRYKLEHLKQWESVRADWLKHATYLTSLSPRPDRLVLDSWTGTLDFRGVSYDKTSRRWSAAKQMMIGIEGEAVNREIADALRAALVQTSVYEVSSTGADTLGGKRMPYGFTYRLRTGVGSPAPPESTSPESTPQEPTPPVVAPSGGNADVRGAVAGTAVAGQVTP